MPEALPHKVGRRICETLSYFIMGHLFSQLSTISGNVLLSDTDVYLDGDSTYHSAEILSLANELSEDEISADGYLRCYVCESKKADYPVGTVFTDIHTENQMLVAGYFPTGALDAATG